MYRRLLLAVLVLFLLVCLVAGLGLYSVYRAAVRVPEFYEQALQADPLKQAAASDEMLQETAAVASKVEQGGQWGALFTQDQVNGWLAVDLVRNHRDSLPEGLEDPRAAIDEGDLRFGCRAVYKDWKVVISLAVEAYVDQPNVITVRFKEIRAGTMPLPMSEILDKVSKVAAQEGIKITWQQDNGKPVALLDLSSLRLQDGRRVEVRTIEIRPGEIYLAGTSEPKKTEKKDEEAEDKEEEKDGSPGPSTEAAVE
jgi:uncharacterized protein YpmS